MRVLLAHVNYRVRGGEDLVVENEAALLKRAGVEVDVLLLDSRKFDDLPPVERAALALTFRDHTFGRRAIREAITRHHPDVVHFHNLYPLLGPGAVREARSLGCAVVQTVHNYRWSCLAGTHLLDGQVCERCSPGSHAPGIYRGCYRGSRLQSLLLSSAVASQWKDAVSGCGPDIAVFLAPPMSDRFAAHGYPEGACIVKANSVDARDPLIERRRDGVLYVGRLSNEKGVLQLVRAWPADAPLLMVAGFGPLFADIRDSARSNIRVLGDVGSGEVRELLRSSRVLAMPSLCPEGQPLAMLEALSEGTPVVCFSGTSMAETVGDVTPEAVVSPMGDFDGFVRTLLGFARNDKEFGASTELRRLHEDRFSHETNLRGLMEAYSAALAAASGRGAEQEREAIA